MIDRTVQGAAGRLQEDAVVRVCYDSVGDVQYRVARRECKDASLAESVKLAIVDGEHRPRIELNAVEAGAGVTAAKIALKLHVPNRHDVGRSGRNTYSESVRRPHHRGNSAAAVDGDRLGNGHRAKTARVQRVDFSARRRLRNGAGEGHARRRSAARIVVVTDTRYPGSRRLSVSRNRAKHG